MGGGGAIYFACQALSYRSKKELSLALTSNLEKAKDKALGPSVQLYFKKKHEPIKCGRMGQTTAWATSTHLLRLKSQ